MVGYNRAGSGQRIGKHVPAATDMNPTIDELESVKRGLEPEAEK
jgi:hypothetical protein